LQTVQTAEQLPHR